MGLPENITGIPISFFLKNKLHLSPHQIAIFYLIASIPAYCAVTAFGFRLATSGARGVAAMP